VSLQANLLAAADIVASRTGWLDRRLDAEALLRSAQQRTGLADLGDSSILGPLQRLLDALVDEASLSVVGRFAARWDTIRMLSNLLRFQAEEVRSPTVLRQRIEQPMFITGLPRSGTTFLHRLMMADPSNRAPLVWQTIYPYPPARGADRRRSIVARQLKTFERLSPEFHAVHPLYANSPQECSEITAHVFRSLRFDTTYKVPSYRKWLDQAGHIPSYRFHKRFLQHLQHQESTGAKDRWVLKCPDHVFAFEAIRAIYPDARLIFVHRDPVKMLLSVAKLTELIRRPFARQIDKVAIGQQESARWQQGARLMIDAARADHFDRPICHVHYLDLVTDPLATIDSVYRHFGLRLSADAEQWMALAIRCQPNGGYGAHSYRFEDHGFDPATERANFRDYMVAFGIQPEGRDVAWPAAQRLDSVSIQE